MRGLLAALLALSTGCAATFVVGDASAKLCHTDDGGTLSDNAVKAAAAAAEGAARGALGGGVPSLPDFGAEGPTE